MSEEEDNVEYLGERIMDCCDRLKRIHTDAVFVKQTPQHPREIEKNKHRCFLCKINTSTSIRYPGKNDLNK